MVPYILSRLVCALALLAVAFSSTVAPPSPQAQFDVPIDATFIVQAGSADVATALIHQAGGAVVDRLAIIDGVVATLDQGAVARLRQTPGVALHTDTTVGIAEDEGGCTSGADDETDTNGCALYPAAATSAHTLHEQSIPTRKTECKAQGINVTNEKETRELQGWGVTVAVIDSGFIQMARSSDWQYRSDDGTMAAENNGRCIIYRDFLPRTTTNGNADGANSTDQNGHGTHVVSTIGDNRETSLAPSTNVTPVGVAPQVNLLVARALDKRGAGTYANVIKAIEWIVANKDRYNVRVLNLSLYSPVTGPYWADPLNQAVMKAWRAGITVVVAAGNDGPTAGTITVPGNVPYVITVGAIKSGRYTASGADELATYSSRGPTESAFVKPDILVPASRTISPMPDGSTLAETIDTLRNRDSANCPQNDDDDGGGNPDKAAAYCFIEKAQVDLKVGAPASEHAYYQLSGTSMAAAEVSGIVALILQQNPQLTNDQVKHRLMSTARPAVEEKTGTPIYTIWEQGAGLVDVDQAVFTTTTAAANVGMDINLDLTTNTHYWGYTKWDQERGQFQLVDPRTGQQWTWGGGLNVWSGGGTAWSGGLNVWSGGHTAWGGGLNVWSGGTSTWASNESLWAGSNRIWAGSNPETSLSTASRSELLVKDEAPPPTTVPTATPTSASTQMPTLTPTVVATQTPTATGMPTATPTDAPVQTPTLAPSTVATVAPTATAPITTTGGGLQAEYFGSPNLNNRRVVRTDATVDFNWNTGAPDPVLGGDNFSVRWSGSVAPRYSEPYTFYTASDDGVRLWVNDQLLIDNWTNHSATENSGTITLQAGQKYALKLEYYERGGKAVAQLGWSSPSQAKEIIPQSQLYPPSASEPQSSNQSVTSLTLFDADTNRPIAGYEALTDTLTLDLAKLPAKNLSIRANTNPSRVGSVQFTLDGAFVRVENYVPYTIAGDVNGKDYLIWGLPPVGQHTLVITPYGSAKGAGAPGKPLTLRLSVVNGANR
jgi:subtilisin family serine protease